MPISTGQLANWPIGAGSARKDLMGFAIAVQCGLIQVFKIWRAWNTPAPAGESRNSLCEAIERELHSDLLVGRLTED